MDVHSKGSDSINPYDLQLQLQEEQQTQNKDSTQVSLDQKDQIEGVGSTGGSYRMSVDGKSIKSLAPNIDGPSSGSDLFAVKDAADEFQNKVINDPNSKKSGSDSDPASSQDNVDSNAWVLVMEAMKTLYQESNTNYDATMSEQISTANLQEAEMDSAADEYGEMAKTALAMGIASATVTAASAAASIGGGISGISDANSAYSEYTGESGDAEISSESETTRSEQELSQAKTKYDNAMTKIQSKQTLFQGITQLGSAGGTGVTAVQNQQTDTQQEEEKKLEAKATDTGTNLSEEQTYAGKMNNLNNTMSGLLQTIMSDMNSSQTAAAGKI